MFASNSFDFYRERVFFFCCECVLFKACLAWEDNLVLQQHISQTQPMLLLQLKLRVVREIYFVF